jgi:hypothetical protein
VQVNVRSYGSQHFGFPALRILTPQTQSIQQERVPVFPAECSKLTLQDRIVETLSMGIIKIDSIALINSQIYQQGFVPYEMDNAS